MLNTDILKHAIHENTNLETNQNIEKNVENVIKGGDNSSLLTSFFNVPASTGFTVNPNTFPLFSQPFNVSNNTVQQIATNPLGLYQNLNFSLPFGLNPNVSNSVLNPITNTNSSIPYTFFQVEPFNFTSPAFTPTEVPTETGGILGLSPLPSFIPPKPLVTTVPTETGAFLGLSPSVVSGTIPIVPTGVPKGGILISAHETGGILKLSSPLTTLWINETITTNLNFVNHIHTFLTREEVINIKKNPVSAVMKIYPEYTSPLNKVNEHVPLRVVFDILNTFKNPNLALNSLKNIKWEEMRYNNVDILDPTKPIKVEVENLPRWTFLESQFYTKTELTLDQKKTIETILILMSKPGFNWKDFFVNNQLSIQLCDEIYLNTPGLSLEDKNKWCQATLNEVLKISNFEKVLDEKKISEDMEVLGTGTSIALQLLSAVGNTGALTLLDPTLTLTPYGLLTVASSSLFQRVFFKPEEYITNKAILEFKKAQTLYMNIIRDSITKNFKEQFYNSSKLLQNSFETSVKDYYDKPYIHLQQIPGIYNVPFSDTFSLGNILEKNSNETVILCFEKECVLRDVKIIQSQIYREYNTYLAMHREEVENFLKNNNGKGFIGFANQFLLPVKDLLLLNGNGNDNNSVILTENNEENLKNLLNRYFGIVLPLCNTLGLNQTQCHELGKKQFNKNFNNNTFNFENFTNFSDWENTSKTFNQPKTTSYAEWLSNWLENVKKILSFIAIGGVFVGGLYSQRSQFEWMRKYMLSSLMYTTQTVLIIDKKDGKPKRARANVCLHWNLQTLEDRLRQYDYENPNVMNEYLHYFVLGEENNIIFFSKDQKINVILKNFICNMSQFKKSVCFLLKPI